MTAESHGAPHRSKTSLAPASAGSCRHRRCRRGASTTPKRLEPNAVVEAADVVAAAVVLTAAVIAAAVVTAAVFAAAAVTDAVLAAVPVVTTADDAWHHASTALVTDLPHTQFHFGNGFREPNCG